MEIVKFNLVVHKRNSLGIRATRVTFLIYKGIYVKITVRVCLLHIEDIMIYIARETIQSSYRNCSILVAT